MKAISSFEIHFAQNRETDPQLKADQRYAMLPPIRPTFIQTIASGCQSLSKQFRCSRREACELIGGIVDHGIPLAGTGLAGLTGRHLWNNNQRILACCSIALLSLGTMAVWVYALKRHPHQHDSWIRRRILPLLPENSASSVAPRTGG